MGNVVIVKWCLSFVLKGSVPASADVPPRPCPRGLQVRVKNTGSHAHKRGRKRPKYQAPCREYPQTSSVIENAPIHAKGSNCDRVKYSLKAWVEAWGCDQRRNAATSDSPRRVTPTR